MTNTHVAAAQAVIEAGAAAGATATAPVLNPYVGDLAFARLWRIGYDRARGARFRAARARATRSAPQ